jgi:hypothetical protein
MAHFWVYDQLQWAVLPLNERPFSLRQQRCVTLLSPGDIAWKQEVVLIPCARPAGELRALVAGAAADVRINGIRLSLGIQILRDRDEICVGWEKRFYFSTERLALIEPFPGSAADTICPRCRQAVEAGHPSVQCPSCGVWHHNSGDFPCWTYSETCALCSQETALDDAYRWTPEGI